MVAEGHRLAPQAPEAVRGDGFVTETNIQYPTDASLVVDGLRVMLRLVARLSKLTGVTGWRHAGIESAIHALMAGNGLDRCRDRGEHGYERYVALAVLGRNLHTLGRLVLGKRRRQRQAA